ncbi:MAG: molybdopterin molybdotransferase MoeA, partial [Porticoccaceae bacterium]
MDDQPQQGQVIMDCCNTTGLLAFETAYNHLLNDVHCTLASEEIPLASALNRILAVDICASIQVPSSDNSAMDGYALRADDLTGNHWLELVGQSYAGHPYSGRINPGECIRIMTGAVIPNDADTVEMQENTSAADNKIYFSKPVKRGQHVRRAGEDIDNGDTVLTAGRRLTPVDLGLLASLGISKVTVYKPLRVAVFSSGDELCSPGTPLIPGCIYESNSFVICAMLRKLGFNVTDLGVIADTEQAIEDVFSTAAKTSDV